MGSLVLSTSGINPREGKRLLSEAHSSIHALATPVAANREACLDLFSSHFHTQNTSIVAMIRKQCVSLPDPEQAVTQTATLTGKKHHIPTTAFHLCRI